MGTGTIERYWRTFPVPFAALEEIIRFAEQEQVERWDILYRSLSEESTNRHFSWRAFTQVRLFFHDYEVTREGEIKGRFALQCNHLELRSYLREHMQRGQTITGKLYQQLLLDGEDFTFDTLKETYTLIWPDAAIYSAFYHFCRFLKYLGLGKLQGKKRFMFSPDPVTGESDYFSPLQLTGTTSKHRRAEWIYLRPTLQAHRSKLAEGIQSGNGSKQEEDDDNTKTNDTLLREGELDRYIYTAKLLLDLLFTGTFSPHRERLTLQEKENAHQLLRFLELLKIKHIEEELFTLYTRVTQLFYGSWHYSDYLHKPVTQRSFDTGIFRIPLPNNREFPLMISGKVTLQHLHQLLQRVYQTLMNFTKGKKLHALEESLRKQRELVNHFLPQDRFDSMEALQRFRRHVRLHEEEISLLTEAWETKPRGTYQDPVLQAAAEVHELISTGNHKRYQLLLRIKRDLQAKESQLFATLQHYTGEINGREYTFNFSTAD